MKGIDISNYQGNVDFEQVKNAGVEIVIIKATEGKTWQDPRFMSYYNDAKAAGLKVGAYHFLRRNAVEDEANNLLSVIRNLKLECKVIIDAEVDLGGVAATSQHIKQFYELLKSKGYDVALYTYTDFYNNNLNSTVKDIPLWIANYGSRAGVSNYIGWQYSDKGNILGITGHVDINEFNNSIYAGNSQVTQPKIQNGIVKCAQYIGSRCKELQQKLIACGYNCGGYGADGSFGMGTYNSLIAFQQDHGLSADGLAGPATFEKLNQAVTQNTQTKPITSTQYDVRYLQHELNVQCNAGLSEDNITGSLTRTAASRIILKQGANGNITRWVQAHVGAGVDGSFGPATLSAVQVFQRNHGLSADGVVGPNTWNALLS